MNQGLSPFLVCISITVFSLYFISFPPFCCSRCSRLNPVCSLVEKVKGWTDLLPMTHHSLYFHVLLVGLGISL